MKKATAVTLKDIAPQLRTILAALRGLDERAGGLSENAWLHEEIQIMRAPGRERDRRRELDEAAEKRERDLREIERDYANLIGLPVDEVAVDHAKINRFAMYVSNLLRETGDRNA